MEVHHEDRAILEELTEWVESMQPQSANGGVNTAELMAQFEEQLDDLDNKMDADLYPMEPPVYNEFTDDEIMNFIVSGNTANPQIALRSNLEQQKLLDPQHQKSPTSPSHTSNSVSSQQVQIIQPNINNTSNTTQSTTPKLIEEVVTLVRQLSIQLEKIRWEQHQVIFPIPKEAYLILDKQQKECKSAIDWAQKRLNHLLDTVIVEPREMELILQFLDQLAFLERQLDLFIIELQSMAKNSIQPAASLMIVAQPFPSSVKQNKSLDEPLAVRLLISAKCEFTGNCVVKAEIVNQGSATKGKRNTIGVDNAEKYMNEGIAAFNDIKFPNGTRLKSVQLKFLARVNLRDPFGMIHTLHIESNPSHHFIVKTNENQWYEAEGILLQETSFNGVNEISWPRFMNWLNRCYLMATRQNIQTPLRILNFYDCDYLHKLKFDNSSIITRKQFEQFWGWFGPILHKIRYQRHICSLWTRGYIAGFLTRDEVEAVLKNEKVGTFLIRFSERVAGMFAVAYQATEPNGEKKVKHYLMKADDTHAAKKSLADFLGEYKDFTCMLQIWFEPQTNRRILRRCDKDTVLKEYYSKKPANVHEGYEDHIQVT